MPFTVDTDRPPARALLLDPIRGVGCGGQSRYTRSQ